MADQKPSVEVAGEIQRLQPADRLDTTFTNDRLPTKTGILKGWVPSIDTSTTVDFSAGDGWLVDNETDPLLPTHFRQTTGALLAQTVLNVASETFTYFYIDGANALQQQNTKPTRSEFRTKQFIAVSYQLAGALVDIYPLGQSGGEGDLFAYDILGSIGIVSDGNFFDKATAGSPDPLNLKVSAGTMGYANANRGDTVAKRRDPHFVAQIAVDPVTWTYINNDGSDGVSIESTGVTLVDTANRSNGIGGLVALATNRSGLAVIYRDPQGNVAIEYTTAEFNPANTTAEDAFELALVDQSLVMSAPPFEELYVLEYPKDETDLDNCIFHRLTSGRALSAGGGDGAAAVTLSSFAAKRTINLTFSTSTTSTVLYNDVYTAANAAQLTYDSGTGELTAVVAMRLKVRAEVGCSSFSNITSICHLQFAVDTGGGFSSISSGHQQGRAMDPYSSPIDLSVETLIDMAIGDKIKVYFYKSSSTGTTTALADSNKFIAEVKELL